MTASIEQEENVEALQGEVQQPQQRQRLFKTFKALTDYCEVFGIYDGAFNSGIMQDTGQKVFVLTYLNTENI